MDDAKYCGRERRRCEILWTVQLYSLVFNIVKCLVIYIHDSNFLLWTSFAPHICNVQLLVLGCFTSWCLFNICNSIVWYFCYNADDLNLVALFSCLI